VKRIARGVKQLRIAAVQPWGLQWTERWCKW